MCFLIEEYLTPQAFTGEATLEDEDDEDPEPAASDEKGEVVTTLEEEDEDDEDPEPAASDKEGVAITGGSVNLYMYAVNFP